VHAPLALTAAIGEAQLMSWRLQIAAAGSDAWSTLAEQEIPALAVDQTIALGRLDPREASRTVSGACA
jgi:hypothetical protein